MVFFVHTLRPQPLLPEGVADSGFKQAMQYKWVALDKSSGAPLLVRKVDSIQDSILPLLQAVSKGETLGQADLDTVVKKRRLVKLK